MSLAPGTRLGPYEIGAPIGKGGMGEVYRARDTKLGREVAIKILPEELAADEERVARFEREAKLLASLNHPNIAGIYGLEESESLQPESSAERSDVAEREAVGVGPHCTNRRIQALVLELVEGPTLAERIAQGPIPIEEALPIARQVAEALEAGHEVGVVHRDLKPANVKVRDDGTVKVLDYGLAKALGDDSPSGAGADTELSQSPTLTRQSTSVGVILGTASYMSPEQAKGKRVDKRTDIFAFGTLLYEMLSGKRAFPASGVFLAERVPGNGWRQLSYAEAREAADSLSQALLDRGLGPDRPVMLLSGNSIDHALLTLGAMQVGVPVVPVSPAYSLMSRDHVKVKHIFELCSPGLVYAADRASFAPALGALDLEGVEVVVSAHEPGDKATPFASLVATPPSAAVDAAFDRVGPDSVCKILFTSGSTGTPKGVINTQRMLCSSQQALAQVWPFVEADPPVLLDWLPWNHTFGGNNNFNLVLRNGGTLYIDGGRPAPGLFDISIANLREVSPNIYYNVPAGFQMLLTALESDEKLRDKFFSKLKVVMYAGAALPSDAWRRLESLSVKSLGKRVPLTSAWGSTETAPMATIAHFILESAGNIGVPAPGVTIKMVPAGDKMELRVKGPNVTPGYYRRDDLTEAAFDDEGFYCIGDAGRLIDPDDANKGIAFDGRVAEDFKLSTGTWVAAGALRVAALAAVGPILRDAVVTGHDRELVGLLAWPDIEACRVMAGASAEASPESIIAHPEVRAHVATQLAVHNREAGGKSRHIHRVLLMTEPPSIDANEITDKGYINQRATLTRRADLVRSLYAEPPGPDVIVILN